MPGIRMPGGTRRPRCLAAGAILGVIALAATACSGGTEPDPKASALAAGIVRNNAVRAQVSTAVDDLAGTPVLAYDGALAGTDTSGKVKLTVTRKGVSLGKAHIDGDDLKVLTVDGHTFLKGDTSYWKTKLTSDEERKAKQFADTWVKVADNELGFDPADLLTPDAFAKRIRAALTDVGTPVADKVGDTKALRVPVTGGGAIYITAEKPYRVLRVDIPGLLADSGTGSGGSGSSNSMDLTRLDAKGVDGFYDDMDDAAGKLKNAMDAGIRFTQNGSSGLKCHTGGACTANVSFNTTAPGSDTVDAVLHVSMDAKGLKAHTCSAHKSVKPNKSATMKCSTNFHLAPSPHPKSYNVLAKYVLTAEASVDTSKIKKNLKTEHKKDHDAAED